MTHDWAAPLGGVEAITARLDEQISEIITAGVKDAKFSVAETVEAEPLTLDSLQATMEMVGDFPFAGDWSFGTSLHDMIAQHIRREQNADLERVEEAIRRATALEQGTFVVLRYGRVGYAEPSEFVPVGQIYLGDLDSWARTQMGVDMFAHLMRPFDPNID